MTKELLKIDLDDIKNRYVNDGDLICCSVDTANYPHIQPIVFLKDDVFYNISNEDSRTIYNSRFKEHISDTEEIFSPLYERFLPNELFLLNRFADNKSKWSAADPYFFAFGNDTLPITNHQALEVFDGFFSLENDFFVPKHNELLELLKNKIDKGITNRFYVKTQDTVFGPFEAKKIETNSVKLAAVTINNDTIYEWNYSTIKNDSIFEFSEPERNNKIIRSITSGWLKKEDSKKSIIFKPDSEILKWVSQRTKKSCSLTKSDYKKFEEITKAFLSYEVNSDEKFIYKRAIKLIEKSKENKKIVDGFIDFLPGSSIITEKLEALEKEAEETLYKNKIIKKENKEIDEEIKNNTQIKNDLLNKIEELKKKTEFEQIEVTKRENEELTLQIKKDETLRKESEKREKYSELYKINAEIRKKENAIEDLKEKERELSAVITDLSDQFINKQKEAHSSLRELIKSKTHFDFISGRNFEDENKTVEDFSPIIIDSFYKNVLEDTGFVSHEKFLLDKIATSLKYYGRNYDNNFIANVLISLYQNMGTIFAGLPGTGKTSLARIISKILTKDNRKVVEIPVARGWSSQKDFIGFYNPLSKKFIPTNEKMYSLLRLSDEEVSLKTYKENNIGIVILDEANLSPMEHYWSSFYNLTDSRVDDENMLEINIGTEAELKFANNIRFISTINIDQTTEELSPRILDRCNVIRIPTDNISYTHSANKYNSQTDIEINFSDIIKLFNLKDFNNGLTPEDLENESYKKIYLEYCKTKDALKKLKITVSPRIDNAFTDYFLTALRFMPEYKALDYFIAQRLLTKIDGQGEAYKKNLAILLEKLKEIFINDHSTKSFKNDSIEILEEIIETGSESEFYNNYNYFLIS
ncbi:ATP-binding protein [Desulfotalea psychrophila]|uniref:AAA+ ATPase domain-containing protein n=1 Tax=Desulfotalea psychrophila (strain LSv54 / DSM 12343) TaxID=177439 RepID=Q6AKL5_DESPS|nr:ATP-binding protein [Desulfotalea psychrophila]CAG37110.1 hypothetical protein DP2381 [Desulfotalea psychrophila LSv54]